MAPPTALGVAGVTLAQYAILDTNGYPAGTSGNASTAATSKPMSILSGIKRMGGQAAAPRITNGVGDAGRTRWKIMFAAAEDGNLDMNFSIFDASAHQAFTGNKAVTYGGWTVYLAESNIAVAQNQACIIVTSDAVDETSGQVGVQRYMNEIYPAVYVTPLYGTLEDINEVVWQYQGAPTRSSKLLTGEAMGATTHGATQAARYFWLTTDYPGTIHRYTRSGTASEAITLTYTPGGDHTTNYIQVWQNGTQVAATTGFTVSGKTVTMVGTSTSGSVVIVTYEAVDILTN